MRYQQITIQVPDEVRWRKGDHIPTAGAATHPRGILIVDAAEPVEVPQRKTFDLSISIDVEESMTIPTGVDALAHALRNWVTSPSGPFDRPRQRDVQVVVHGEQTWTP